MKKFLTLILVCFLALPVLASDVLIPASSRYVVLGRGLTWVGNGFGAFNNNFIFSPQDPDQGLCVFVVNNTAAPHNYTTLVQQTGDPTAVSPSAAPSRWSSVPVFGASGNVLASAQSAFFARTQAAARVSISFSNGTGAGTVDLFTVQTSSPMGCASAALAVQGAEAVGVVPTANPLVIGGVNSSGQVARFGVGAAAGAGSGVPQASASNAIVTGLKIGTQQYVSADLGPSFQLIQPFIMCGINALCPNMDYESGFESFGGTAQLGSWTAASQITNPTLNQNLLSFAQTGSGSGNPAFFKSALIDCSAACDIQVVRVTSLGTTCTTVPASSTYLNSGAAYAGQFSGANGAIQQTCTTNPTQGNVLYELTLNATTPYTLDLRGVTCAIVVGQPCGIMLISHTAFTGNFTATVAWYEP